MDSNRILTIVATCLSVIAIAFSAYAIVSDQHSNDEVQVQNHYTDDQIRDLVPKLQKYGGTIFTAVDTHTLSIHDSEVYIKDNMLVLERRFSSYSISTYFIPFSSIEYISVAAHIQTDDIDLIQK